MALTALLGAAALWFRRAAGRVSTEKRFRVLVLALLEKILKASNKACCTLDCPWDLGKIPEAYRREMEILILKIRQGD